MLNVEYLRKFTIRARCVPGAVIFLDLIRKYFIRRTEEITVDDFDGDIKITLALDEHMSSQIFWYGYYSRDILFVLDRILKPGMVVVDIGSNIGEITLFAAKHVGRSGRVYAFEAGADIADRLKSNVAQNDFSQVVIVPQGVSDHVGSAPIFGSIGVFSDGSRNTGLATLYASETRSRVINTIPLTTLDVYFQEAAPDRIDVMKIDIEGAELPALRGARRVLKRYCPWLIIEVQAETCATAGYAHRDILSFLTDFGYRFEIIGRKGKMRPVTVDTLGRFQNVLCLPPDGARHA